jgi:branched-chain amino acid transport system substrate-binding protein
MKKIIVAVALLVILLTGCGSQVTGEVVKEDVIKIGFISPMTGSAATYGLPAAKAAIMAAEQINAEGGILGKQIELIVEDGACNAKLATNAANKLIHMDDVNVILGGHCSTESLAIAPIVNENKVLQFASITSSKDFTNSGDYSFRNMPSSDYYAFRLAEYAYNVKDVRKVAVVYEQLDFPMSVYLSFAKSFEELGGEIVTVQAYYSDETDFRSRLLKVSESGADAILFSSHGEDDAILYYRQLAELGMLDEYELIANVVGANQKVFDETNGLSAGAFTVGPYVDPARWQTAKMLQEFNTMYGQNPQTDYFFVASSYDALYLIKDAIESCSGDEVECLKDFLYSVEHWEGAAGTVSFDENGDVLSSLGLHYFDSEGEEIWKQI